MYCSSPSESENNSPTISSLTASPDSLEVEETSTLTCIANDPDGDDLNYSWSSDEGSLSGSGQTVIWNAPDFNGQFSVTCTVDDGNGLSDSESILITVLEPQVPIIGEWQSTTNLTLGRAAHSSLAFNGYMFVIGGTDGSMQYDLQDVQYTSINMDGTLDNWQSTTNLPIGRSNHSSFIHNGLLYLIGGWDATVRYSEINGDGTLGIWDSTVTLPEGRLAHASVVQNNFVYILGGYTNSVNTGLNDVLFSEINPDGTLNDWQSTTSFTQARFDHSSIVHNGIIYILGGENRSTIYTDVQYAQVNPDGTIGQWTATTSLPVPKTAHTCFIFDDKLFVTGGNSNDIIYAEISQSGEIQEWTTSSSQFQTNRGNHTSIVYQDFLYIIGGSDGQNLLNDVQFTRLTETGQD
jgi:hypothetical protein